MIRTKAMLSVGLALCAGAASAQEVVILPVDYLITDLSADGQVGVGNLFGPFETFRYEWGGSPVLLGRGTVNTIGTGAGSPDISYDGSVVSATVLDQSETLQTMGVWTQADGWTTLEDVGFADARSVDNSLTSCWSLSGDGSSVGGFFWYQRPGEFGANPSVWTPADGQVERLPISFDRSGRINGLSYDGSVRAGWEEAVGGAWQPTVWRGQTKFQLSNTDAFSTCEAVNGDGSSVVGSSFVVATQNRAATMWTWDGAGYVQQVLGQLPGTPAFNGWSIANAISDDASIVIGTNFYSLSPGGNADAFVWTPDGGMMEAAAYLASRGVVVAGVDIREATSVSPDGSTLSFIGLDTNFRLRTVMVRFPSSCPVDIDGDGNLNVFDLFAFLGAYAAQEPVADWNEDDAWSVFDLFDYLAEYNAGCP